MRHRILVFASFLFAAFLAIKLFWEHRHFQQMMARHRHDYQNSSSEEDCLPLTPPQQFRTTFGDKTLVRGWPSKGGLYTLRAYGGVELDFLHLDRFNVTPRSEDQAEEDRHCANMRKLGATWWECDEAFEEHDLHEIDLNDRLLVVGWPTGGGVWILRITYREAFYRGVGRLGNAFNMEERCRVIEQLGGIFYADPNTCPDLDLGSD